jgi:hypothetical protein
MSAYSIMLEDGHEVLVEAPTLSRAIEAALEAHPGNFMVGAKRLLNVSEPDSDSYSADGDDGDD